MAGQEGGAAKIVRRRLAEIWPASFNFMRFLPPPHFRQKPKHAKMNATPMTTSCKICLRAFLLGAMLCPFMTHIALGQSARPNFIFILVDDLGWSDLSFEIDPKVPNPYKRAFHTPNIQRIAQAGMSFTDAYAPSPLCTPTRRAIQFGMTPSRQRGSDHIGEFRKKEFLSIAEVLKRIDTAYYCGHIGKWGEYMIGRKLYDSAAFHPETVFGYDVSDGLTGNPTATFFEAPHSALNYDLQLEEDPKKVFSTTQRAIDFMRKASGSGRPFYLQLSHYSIHTAYRSTQEAYELSQNTPRLPHLSDRIPLGLIPMIRDLDKSVGMLLSAMEELGIGDNTYLVFTSDNGGEAGRLDMRNLPLRARKDHLYEGGIRVPFFIKGPGISPKSYSDTPISLADWLPTMVALNGVPSPLEYDIDGRSMANILLQIPDTASRNLIWHKPFGPFPSSAIRFGKWKLLVFWGESYNDYTLELYNLDKDIGERKNLIDREMEVGVSLYNRLVKYFRMVNAELPPNWKEHGTTLFYCPMLESTLPYPNPTGNLFQLDFCDAFTGSIELFSAAGQLLRHYPIESQHAFEVSMEGLPVGIYVLSMTTESGLTKRVKVVKE
jgi:arylsulfatase A-like enzyme